MTYKIGLIGTGVMGNRYFETLSKIDGVMVDVCNKSGHFRGLTCHNDWKELVYNNLDGIIVAADPAINPAVVKTANILGLPILLEKPAALSLFDVQKMEKYKIPILVNYTQLFAPGYQDIKFTTQNTSINKIACLNYNLGPIRSFSSLYDFAPHDLAMCLDLLGDGEFEIRKKSFYTKNNGTMYNFELLLHNKDILIKCGNGEDTKVRKIAVFTEKGPLVYNDVNTVDYYKPMENLINHFFEIINGQQCKIPFSMTVRIHELLYKLSSRNTN